MALSVGFRSLEMTAFGVLQSYAGVGDGFAFGVHDLATDRAEPGSRKSSKAPDGQDKRENNESWQ
jgi:hypothetical protein